MGNKYNKDVCVGAEINWILHFSAFTIHLYEWIIVLNIIIKDENNDDDDEELKANRKVFAHMFLWLFLLHMFGGEWKFEARRWK